MISNTIRERINHEPFEPFRVRCSSGQAYVVSNPDLVVLMKSEIFIAAPNSDRWAQVPYLHIAGLEAIKNGRAKPGRRHRRR